jgi:ribosomal protein L12E/L44/L45/RPP1/RPP2
MTILSFETSMPGVLLELCDQPLDDQVVDVVAAEVGVAVGRDDLHDVVADLEDRDVEGAAAEVVDRDDLVLFLSRP